MDINKHHLNPKLKRRKHEDGQAIRSRHKNENAITSLDIVIGQKVYTRIDITRKLIIITANHSAVFVGINRGLARIIFANLAKDF